MQLHFGTELLLAEWPAAVVCVGTFDGVHLGHREVIRTAVADAREKELPCVLVTFDRHPAAVLAPDRCPKAIASMPENLAEFEKLGVAVAVVLAFDAALSRMSADRFLNEVLVSAVRARELVVGHDFAMGNGREGTTDWLQTRIPTKVVPPFSVQGERVSSSLIRTAVAEGNMEVAAQLLGRPFAVPGVVIGGQKLGRELGFPTANLARSFDQIAPSNGVYAALVVTPFGTYRSAVSIGTRPAVGGRERTIEAYLIEYSGDSLYGMPIEIQLISRLRDELNFHGLEALIAQIRIDVETADRIALDFVG
jgi:riboflavin kinase/FMN adenylyltransferase